MYDLVLLFHTKRGVVNLNMWKDLRKGSPLSRSTTWDSLPTQVPTITNLKEGEFKLQVHPMVIIYLFIYFLWRKYTNDVDFQCVVHRTSNSSILSLCFILIAILKCCDIFTYLMRVIFKLFYDVLWNSQRYIWDCCHAY